MSGASTTTIALEPLEVPLDSDTSSPSHTHTTLDSSPNAGQPSALGTPIVGTSTNFTNTTATSQPLASCAPGTEPGAATADDQTTLQRWHQKARKRKFKAKTALEITVAIFGVFGVIWATFVSLPGLKLQRWSAGNDFLQACLSLDSPSTRSTRCNETISAGPLPPPKWKRDLHLATATMLAKSPSTLASTVVVTVACVVLATVYFRPRMDPFLPVLSMARSPAFEVLQCWQVRGSPLPVQVPFAQYCRWPKAAMTGQPDGDSTQQPVRVDSQGFTGSGDDLELEVDEAESIQVADDEQDVQAKCDGPGQAIGVWYHSDEEDLDRMAIESDSELEQPKYRALSMYTPDTPQLKAFNNISGLQHPQPRQGQTSRIQKHLEFTARKYHHSDVVATDSPALQRTASDTSLTLGPINPCGQTYHSLGPPLRRDGDDTPSDLDDERVIFSSLSDSKSGRAFPPFFNGVKGLGVHRWLEIQESQEDSNSLEASSYSNAFHRIEGRRHLRATDTPDSTSDSQGEGEDLRASSTETQTEHATVASQFLKEARISPPPIKRLATPVRTAWKRVTSRAKGSQGNRAQNPDVRREAWVYQSPRSRKFNDNLRIWLP